MLCTSDIPISKVSRRSVSAVSAATGSFPHAPDTSSEPYPICAHGSSNYDNCLPTHGTKSEVEVAVTVFAIMQAQESRSAAIYHSH